ncbi:MAG TPA: hypothetical protein VGR62_07950 [Candidatus Binatia bacterium]|jgi:hypothetical protein|nr:hypothetical protein [Candidatus Binatia bacterium]
MRFVVLAAVLLVTSHASAALLVLEGDTTLAADGATLHLTARNTGTDAARNIQPHVYHQSHTLDGDVVDTIAPGAAHTWTLALPRPTEPGSTPVIVDLAHTDADDVTRSTPFVTTVDTPGLPPPDVTLTLETTPIGRYGRATLRLDNRGPAAIHGRVVLALPGDVITEPVSQAADAAAGRGMEIPIVLQRQGSAREAILPAYAFFDYGLDGRRHVVLAATTLTIGAPGGPVSPLVVGVTALGVAFAALAVALRAAARRRAATTAGGPSAA